MEAAGAINAKLAILSEKAGNINQVVTTITKVADQTNLLSQRRDRAEEAGQYGRGFAVVRDRDPAPGRPDGGLDLRHRADRQGHPVGRRRRRGGHGQILRRGPARHAGRPAGRRPALGNHRSGTGTRAALRGSKRGHADPGYG